MLLYSVIMVARLKPRVRGGWKTRHVAVCTTLERATKMLVDADKEPFFDDDLYPYAVIAPFVADELHGDGHEHPGFAAVNWFRMSEDGEHYQPIPTPKSVSAVGWGPV